MKKYVMPLILCLFLLPAFSFAEVSARDNGFQERINSYQVNATLLDNASIEVTEEITYDFGTNERHGIFRYIPTVYTGRKGSPRQTISKVTVTDASDGKQSFEINFSGNTKVIKIGDPNRLVTGMHTYKIGYTLNHVVSSDSDGDRFRWDAIGTGWQVPIKNVDIKLTGSSKQTINRVSLQCFLGATGSTEICDIVKAGDTTRVTLASLDAYNGITLDFLFAKGTFPAPSELEVLLWQSYWYLSLPIIALLVFFILWYTKGRDPKGRGTIVPIYDAPTVISPYEASIILEDRISSKALPAAIISLAVKGYIKIHQNIEKVFLTSKTVYELEAIKPLPKTALSIEQRVFDTFFIGRDRVKLDDLGNSFAELNLVLHKKAYREVTEKGYYKTNPTISRIIYLAISAVVFGLGILAAVYLLVPAISYLAFMAPGFIGFIFAFIMPVMTKEGALLREELLGLKLYIKTAEIDRIKFHNAPEKSPQKFEELLPYAIIFGLEKKWAEEFKDVYKTAPGWYDGNISTFSTVALVGSLNSFSDAAINAVVSSSASAASGGFGGVGGGGGGGGGGSW